jgi:hypothetical protein
MTVDVVSGTTTTTVATYSNRDQGRAFLERHVDLSAFAGTSVTLRFTASENASAATSFVLDDTTLSAG